MPTRMLLVRHGESQHKIDGVAGGPGGCRGLTEEGRRQVARLRDRFRGDHSLGGPISLCSSVIPRAIETAQILAQAFDGAQVHQDCDLCSWHVPPEADGTPWVAYRQDHALEGGGVFRPFESGSESWAELVGRVGRSLSTLAQRHRDETTIVVAHAEPVEASFIVLGLLPLYRSFDVQVSCASVTEWITGEDTVAWPPARWTLVRFNDTAHLIEP